MAMTSYLRILTFLVILAIASSDNYFNLVLHSQQRQAACLDGSPAGFYYHLGSGANRNKYLLSFDSGGFCDGMTLADTIQSCYKRSFGSLGTTTVYKPQTKFDSDGLLSPIKEVNPVFYDWTKVFIIYCDGSQYTGYRKSPIVYKGKELYFRGFNNVMEQFYALDKMFDFYNGEKIVITGVSAGGMATYFHSNYLMEHTKKAKVYAIPDSGLFITDFVSPTVEQPVIRIMAENLFKLINDQGTSAFPFPQCLEQYKDDVIQCYNTANLAKYFKAPMMIVESPYDEYSLNNIVVSQCLTNDRPPYSIDTCNDSTRVGIEDYRQQTINGINKIKGNRKDVGLWAPSCVQHGFTDTTTFTDPKFQIPSADGPTVSEAILQFLQNPDSPPWYMDQVPWPYNSGCSGLKKSNLLKH